MTVFTNLHLDLVNGVINKAHMLAGTAAIFA